jgi:hypothetical protein
MHWVAPVELCTQRYLQTAKGNSNEWSKLDYHNRLRNITPEETKSVPGMTWASFRICNKFRESHSHSSENPSLQPNVHTAGLLTRVQENNLELSQWQQDCENFMRSLNIWNLDQSITLSQQLGWCSGNNLDSYLRYARFYLWWDTGYRD